jgi:periplasmic mercuric ion binding protein
MKTIKFSIVAVLAMVLSIQIFAQKEQSSITTSSKTESIKVWGNCNMCKARIEKAAKLGGVSNAEWNKDTKILTVVFNAAEVKSEDIQKSIAAAGYDTGKFKATDANYDALPGCCKYERSK